MRTFILLSFWIYMAEIIFRFSFVAVNVYPRAPNHSRLGDLIELIVALYLGVWCWFLLWG